MAWPTPYYTQDNTEGYTDAELDTFNAELCDILADARANNPDISDLEVQELITQHNQDVSDRD